MTRRRRSHRQVVEADLDILPLMNLFVVLIPMLLLSAVFVQMSSIDLELPGDDPQATSRDDEGLQLAVRLQDDAWIVSGRKLATRTIARSGADAEAELAELLASIRAQHPDERAVRIDSPAEARYQDIVTVMDVSRAAGLSSVSLAGAPSSSRSTRDAR